MKKRFVVAVAGLTTSETKQVSNLFRDKYGWWHWIDGFWLLTDSSNTLTTKDIRDMIATVKPNSRRIVLEVSNSGDWSGHGPNSEKKDMFRWIRETWGG